VYANCRAHSAFIRGFANGSTKKIIKACVLAFPSMWVSYNTRILKWLLLKETATQYWVSPSIVIVLVS
jgi:hypothetical protein